MPTRRTVTALLTVALLGLAAPATAALSTPHFSRPAEALASYAPQVSCSPTAKPGVVRFSRMVLAAYPGTSSSGIVRECAAAGRSEHKEGRAWDWHVSATSAHQKAQAEELLRWLFTTDRTGAKAANARRLGVMYVIWDHRIWGAYAAGAGWRPYAGASPHTDHMHLSFSWAGAQAQTSFWQAGGLPVTAIAPPPPPVGPVVPRPAVAPQAPAGAIPSAVDDDGDHPTARPAPARRPLHGKGQRGQGRPGVGQRGHGNRGHGNRGQGDVGHGDEGQSTMVGAGDPVTDSPGPAAADPVTGDPATGDPADEDS